MYTFVLDDFQSLIMKKTLFFQFRTVHKTSSCNLFAFEATLKESTVRIFLHKEENEKNPNFIVVIVPIDWLFHSFL